MVAFLSVLSSAEACNWAPALTYFVLDDSLLFAEAIALLLWLARNEPLNLLR